jgi:hypothetical protein
MKPGTAGSALDALICATQQRRQRHREPTQTHRTRRRQAKTVAATGGVRLIAFPEYKPVVSLIVFSTVAAGRLMWTGPRSGGTSTLGQPTEFAPAGRRRHRDRYGQRPKPPLCHHRRTSRRRRRRDYRPHSSTDTNSCAATHRADAKSCPDAGGHEGPATTTPARPMGPSGCPMPC